jgi:ParB family transcriptional regulator, chromosome partitioning protein
VPAKSAKRPALAPASRYEILAPSGLPGMEMQDARLLPLDLIDHNPYQARQAFDVEALQELADSIREHGVLEPILVRPADTDRGGEGRYEIVAGERRYRAAAMAEQETIPARIMEMDQKQAAIITALENLQREDLDIEDEARQFAYLCEALDVSQRELAKMLGKNPVYISRRIRLLRRPDLLEEYRSGRLTLHQAAALADPSPEEGVAGAASESDSRGITSGADDEAGDSDSPGITSMVSDSPDESQEDDVQLELIEREDLPGFIVARSGSSYDSGGSSGSDSAGITKNAARSGRRPMFRWRPLQQFSNWVGRTHVSDIPADERATVRAQLASIKEALEKQLAELEQLEKGS